MSAYTNPSPGPWRVTHKRVIERPVRIKEHFAIAPQSGPTFAFLPEGREDIQRANAHLIAAAPEMFRFVEAFAACPTDGEVPGHWSDKAAMDRMIQTARAIVAKAEGR